MKVTKITDIERKQTCERHLYTDDQLRREFGFILAENFTKRMLERELISVGEFDKIMAENKKIFSPILKDILP